VNRACRANLVYLVNRACRVNAAHLLNRACRVNAAARLVRANAADYPGSETVPVLYSEL
jgi:hypothetical protein